MRNIAGFVDFVTETAAPGPIVWVVTVNYEEYWMITSVHRQSEHSEALDVYYQNIIDNYQGGDIDNCVAEWFENLDDDERREYNIPDGVGFDEAFDHIPPDVYQEIWRSCADDNPGVYQITSIDSVPVSSLFDLFVGYSEDRMESEGQDDANIRDFVKEDIEQADMPSEIRRDLEAEMINFRRDTKTRKLFGI
jgi:hypothetical protein